MKNDFADSGNAEFALENQESAFEYVSGDNRPQEIGEVLQSSVLPSYLENWYRNNPATNPILSSYPAQKPGAGFNFLKNQKIKSILKSSLQVFAIAILAITAASLGGFIILDRKINLEGTEASLNRMSQTLAEASSLPPLSPLGQGEKSLDQEGNTTPNTRVLNASANNNVETGSLPIAIDSDQDGISDEVEEKLATNPFLADTDGDGYSDGVEVKNGYDPLTPAVKNTASAPAVFGASATATASSCSASNSSAAGCSVGQNTAPNSAPIVAGASLTAQDYEGLTQMGLSQTDINQAASGGLSNNEKINLQGKVLGSDLMQGSIADVMSAIPAAELPKIADSELNLYKSDREEDINRYFQDLSKVLEESFAGLKNLNSETIKNNILQGNYQDAAMTRQALEKAIAGLAKLPTPDSVKAQSKSLLAFFRIYADLLNEQTLAAPDEASFTKMIANMKALENLAPEFQKALAGKE